MIDRPLIHQAEGADQEDRASLLAAFKRVMHSHRRREISDLHVRELLTYVLAADRDGRGVQLSYDDVANLLCCERSTARSVVNRAEREYGLLQVIEERYVRGGQAPNRYAIDWRAVRSINRDSACAPPSDVLPGAVPVRGSVPGSDAQMGAMAPAAIRMHPGATTAHPGATRQQAPATTAQGPATRAHPFKEHTLNSSLTLSLAAAAAAWAAAAFQGLDFEEVVRRANQLAKRCPSLDREFIWQVCVVGEATDKGKAGEWISSIQQGKVRDPAAYLNAALRRECESLGLDWREVRKCVPKPPPPKTEETAS